MKNRSSIAAGILNSPELLEKSYERSVNSSGVAQKELDTFMDSVESRSNALKNSIQELATETFDVDFLKTIISVANGAVEAITALVDAFGGLRSAISLAAGAMSLKGGGLFNFDKEGNFYSPFWNMISGVDRFNKQKQSMLNIMGTWAKPDEIGNVKLQSAIMSHGGLDKQSQILQDYYNNLDEATKGTKTLQEAMVELSTTTGRSIGIVPRLTSALGSLGTMALNIVSTWAITTLLSTGIKLFTDFINRSNNIIKAGKEAQKTIQDTQEDYQKMADSTEKLGKRYSELRSGVEYTEGQGFSNVSLSTEEYKEFLDINTQIADMYPGLVSGISSGGQVFVELGEDVQQANDKLNEYLEAAREAANMKIAEELPDVLAGLEEKNGKLETKKRELQGKLEDEKNKGQVEYDAENNILKVPEAAQQYLDDLFTGAEDQGVTIDIARTLLGSGYEYQISGNEEFDKQVEDFVERTNATLSANANDLQKQIATIENEEQANFIKDALPGLLGHLNTSSAFTELPEEIQNGITSSLDNIDYNSLPDKKNAQGYVDSFVQNIHSAFETSDNQKQFQEDFTSLFTGTFDDNKTNQEAKDFAKNFLSQIFPDDEERYRFSEMIGLGNFDEETGKFKYASTQLKEDILRNINSGLSEDDQWASDALDNINVGLLEKAQAKINEGTFKFDGAKQSIDDLVEYLRTAFVATEDSTVKFSDLFPEGKLSDTASDYESKLSSITDALKKYREEGYLTSEEQKDLMANLELGDISKESLSTEGLKTLQSYISSIREQIKDEENLDPQTAQAYENYINAIVNTFMGAYENIEKKDLGSLIAQSLGFDEARTSAEKNGITTKTGNILKQLEAGVGGELDTDIVATMAIRGDFAEFDGDMQGLIDKYHELQIQAKINVDDSELQTLLNDLDKRRELQEAQRGVKEAAGGELTPEDYEGTLKDDQTRVDTLNDDLQSQADAITGAIAKYNQLKKDYENGVKGVTKGQVDQAYSDITALQEKFREAQKTASDATSQMYTDQAKADEAAINNIKTEYEDLETEKQKLDERDAKRKAKGFERDIVSYETENRLRKQMNRNLLKQNAELEKQKNGFNNDDKDREIEANRQLMRENRRIFGENNEEIQKLRTITPLQDLISEYETQRQTIEAGITQAINSSEQRANQEQYDALEDNLDHLITEKTTLLNQYQGQIDKAISDNNGKETAELRANTQYQEAQRQVATLTDELGKLQEDKTTAHNNAIIAGFNDQLANADALKEQITTLDDNINTTKEQITSYENSERDTAGLQAELSDYYAQRREANKELFNIYKSVGKSITGQDKLSKEESQKWLDDASKYQQDSQDDNRSYIEAQIAKIQSNESREARIADRNRLFDKLVRDNEGNFGTHEYYGQLRTIARANERDQKIRIRELRDQYSAEANKGDQADREQLTAIKTEWEKAKDEYNDMRDKRKQEVDVPDREVEVNDLQRQLDELQDVQAQYDAIINDSSQATPSDIFANKDANLKQQLEVANELSDAYDELLNLGGLTDEDKQRYSQGKLDAEILKNNLPKNIADNVDQNYGEQLRKETVQYNQLQQAAQEYQNVINNTNHTKTAEDYKNLISNGGQQITSLERQIEVWKKYQATIKDKTSSDWANAQTNIDGLSNSIASMTVNMDNWAKSIENLNIDKINQALELNKALQSREQAKLESKGKREDLLPEDYEDLIAEREEGVELAENKINETKKNLRRANKDAIIGETLGKELISDEELSQKQADVVNAETAYIQAQDDLHNTLTEAQQSELNPLITNLNDLQTQYDNLSSTISNSNELIGTSTYDKQIDLGKQIIENLTNEATIWDQIADERRESSEYSEQEAQDANDQAEKLRQQASGLAKELQEVRGKSIISQFNEDLKEMSGFDSNIKNVEKSIADIKDEMGESDTDDDRDRMSRLESLYSTEEYWATQLETLYGSIADRLEAAGLTEQAEQYRQLQEQYGNTKTTAQQGQREWSLQSLNVSGDLQNELNIAQQRKSNQEALKKAITDSGKDLTAKDYMEDYDISTELTDIYSRIIGQLTDNLKKATTEEEKDQIKSALGDYGVALAEEQANQVNSQYNAQKTFSNLLSKKLGETQDKGKDIARQIEDLTTQGFSVPDELYDKQQKNFDEQINKGERLKANLGKVKNFVSAFLPKDYRDAVNATLDEEIRKAEEDISNATKGKKESEDSQNLQYYNNLGHQLDDLKGKAQEYQDAMTEVGHIANEQDYKRLISNGEEQKKILQDQLDYWKQQQELYKDDTMSEGYQTAAENIRNIGEAMRGVSKDQAEWNKALNDLPIANYERIANLFASDRSIANSLNSIKEATGHILAPEDYDRQVADLKKEIESAWGIVDEKKDDLVNASQMGVFLNEAGLDNEDEIQEAQTEVNNATADAYAKELELINTRREQIKSSTNDEDAHLQILESENQTLQDTIKNVEALGKNAGADTYQGLLDNIFGVDFTDEDGNLQHINGQLDELVSKRADLVEQANKFATEKDENGDVIFGVDSQEYADVMAQIDAVDQAMAESLIQAREYQVALKEAPYKDRMDAYSRVLEENQKNIDETNAEIARAEERGENTDVLNSQLEKLYANREMWLNKSAELYREVAEQISATNPDVAKSLRDQADEFDQQAADAVGNQADTNKKLIEMSKEAQDEIDKINNSRTFASNLRDYYKSQGQNVDELYYDEEIKNSKRLQEIYQNELQSLDDQWNSGEIDHKYEKEYLEQRSKLLEDYYAEVNKQAENEDNKDLVNVQQLEQDAEGYSNALDKIKDEIDDFTEHGKIVSEGMYQDEAKSYRDLAKVYDDISAEYEELARNEKDLEKRTGFEKQAQQAKQSADEYRNAVEEVNDTIQKNRGMSTFEQLMAVDSDKGISNVTKNFQERMGDIIEIQNKQLQGESLDLTQLRIDYPELSGITDLGDSLSRGLGDMKSNALVDYLDDYLSVVSDYPDAIGQAQSMLVDVLGNFDLSDVNLEEVGESLEASIRNAFKAGKISFADAMGLKQQIADAIDSGDTEGAREIVVSLVTAWLGLDPAEAASMYDHTQVVIDLKANDEDLKNTINNLEKAGETNDLIQGREESERNLANAQGKITLPSDYDGTIEAQQDNIQIQNATLDANEARLSNIFGGDEILEGYFKNFMNELNSGTLKEAYASPMKYLQNIDPTENYQMGALADYFKKNGWTSFDNARAIFNDIIKGQTNVNSANADLVNTQNEQIQAISNFSNAIDEGLQQRLDNIRANQERVYTETGIRDKGLIQSEIDLLNGEVQDNLRQKISDLTTQLFEAEANEDAWTVDDKGRRYNKDAEDFRGQLENARNALAEIPQQIAQKEYDLASAEGDDELVRVNQLNSSYQELMSSIEAANQAKQDVPDSDYQQLNSNLQEQVAIFEQLKSAQESLRDTAPNQDIWNQADEAVQGYTSDISDLNGKIQDNNLAMAETPASIQSTIDSLNMAREANNSRISLTEALGGMKTEEQLKLDTQISEELIKAYSGDVAQKILAMNSIENDPATKETIRKQIEGLYNTIRDEQAHIATNERELAELPAQQYLQIADQLSTSADEANRLINDSIRDYGYADADLYKNYGQVLEAQKTNNDALAITYANLANQYEGTEFGTTFAEEAAKYLLASSDVRSAIEENNEAVEQAEMDMPFEAMLRNESGFKNIKGITDDIQSVTEAINEYQTQLEDGENLNLTDIQKQFAELSDVESLSELPDAFDDLQLDKLDKFYNDFKDRIANLSDEQRDEAQKYFQNVFAGLDLSNIDTSKIQDQIHNILWKDVDGSENAIESYLNDYIAEGGNAQVALTVAYNTELFGETPEDVIQSMSPQTIEIEFMTKKNAIEKFIKGIERQIEENNINSDVAQSAMGLYESQGYSVPKNLYEQAMKSAQANVDAYAKIYASRQAEYNLAVSKNRSEAEQSAAYIDMKSAQKDWLDAREGFTNAQVEYREADIDRINTSLELLKSNAENVASSIDNAVEAGSKGTAEQYQYMIENASTQYGYLETQLSEWRKIRDENAPGVEGANLTLYTDAITGIGETLSAQQELNSAVEEYQLMLHGGGEIQELGNSLKDLEDINSAINDQISLRESKGLKGTKKQYEALVENGEKQIDNLEKQNNLIKWQRNNLKLTRATMQRLNDDFNANNSAIASMQGNIDAWNKSLKAVYESFGTDMLNALTQAFTESESVTGLTTETMSTLLAQFSEMSGFDMSGIFYNTAQGIKLDVDATKMLVDAQYQIRSSDLRSQIEQQTNAYKEQMQIVREAGSNATDSQRQQAEASRQTLNELWQQMSQYQALYAQQQYLFSNFADWERAQASENAGAKFESIQGYKDTYKDLWDKGLTGTDDYKTYTAMIDEWGRTSSAAYQGVQEKLDRYFTEDISGIKNFVDDLVTHGYLTQEGTQYIGNGYLDNVQAAHDLGIGEEAFKYLLGRAEDYNAVVDYADSQIEAELKIQEATQKNIDATKEYHRLLAEGAPAEAIQEQADLMEESQQSISNYNDMIAHYEAESGRITSSEIKQGIDTIGSLSEAMSKETNEQIRNMYRTAIEEEALKHGNLALKEDDLGNLGVDLEAIEKMYPNWQSAIQKLSDISSDYVREGFDFEKDVANTETWNSDLEIAKSNFKNLQENGQQFVDTLQGIDIDKLKSIDLTNGDYDSEELKESEKALDGISELLGVSGENLVSILDMFGLLNESTQTDYERQQGVTEQIQDSLDVVNEMEQQQAIDIPFDVQGVEGDMDHLQSQLDYFKKGAEDPSSITLDTDLSQDQLDELQQACDDLASKTEIDMKIRAQLDGAEDAEAKLEEMREWDDDTIATFLEVDADTEEGEKAIETFKHEIGTDESATIPVVVSLDEKQFNKLISAIQKEPIEKTVKLRADASELETEQLQLPPTYYNTLSNEARTETARQAFSGIDLTIPSVTDQISLQVSADTTQAQADIQSLDGQEIEGELTVDEDLPPTSMTVIPDVDKSNLESDLGTAEMNVHYNPVGGADISNVSDQNANVNVTTTGTDEVEALSTAVKNVEGKQADVSATVTGTDETTALKEAIDTVYAKHVTVGASVYGTGEVNALTGAIDSVYSKHVTVGATALGLDGLNSLKKAIDEIQSKTVTVTVNTVNNSSGGSNNGVHTLTGTLISPAYAKGTIPTDLLGERLIDKQGIGHGNVGLKHNENSLINELGTESIIRDGKWFLVPGGPHIEKLQKNDIVLNHKQTEDLIEHGKTAKHGKVVGNAFANGTNKDLTIKATDFDKLEGLKITVGVDEDFVAVASKGFSMNWDSSSAGGAGATTAPAADPGYSDEGSGGSGGSGGGGGGGSSDSGDTPKFSYEVFDHVQRALELLARATENVANRITEYITPTAAKNLYNKQLQKIIDELNGNATAMDTYNKYANSILHNYVYADEDGNRATVDITKYFSESDLRKGNLKKLQYIDTTDEEAKAAVEGANAFLDYLRSAEECEDALITLANDLGDVYQSLIDLPMENLEKAIDRISNKLDSLQGVTDALSTGETGLQNLRNALGLGFTKPGKNNVTVVASNAQTNLDRNANRVRNAEFYIDRLTKRREEVQKRQEESKPNVIDLLANSGLSSTRQSKIIARLNNGWKINNTSDMTGDLLDAIKQWNSNAVSLASLKEQIKNASNGLTKLDNSQTRLERTLNTATRNQAALSNNENVLDILNSTSTTSEPLYRTQNRNLNRESNLERSELIATRNAYNSQVATTKRIQKDSNAARKKLLGSKNLTKAQRNAIEKGKQLDVTNIDASLYKWAVQYNKIFDAKQKEEELNERLIQQASEYAANETERQQQRLENINNYYESLSDWESVLADRESSQRELMESGGYLVNGTNMMYNYQQQMSHLAEQALKDQENAATQLRQINDDVKNGKLIYGSQEWREAMKVVEELGMNASDARVEIVNLYEEFANIPTETANEKIDQLQNYRQRLYSFFDSGLADTVQTQRQYTYISEELMDHMLQYAQQKYGETSKVYANLANEQKKLYSDNTVYGGGEDRNTRARSYLGENKALEEDLKRLKQIAEIRADAYADTLAIYEDTRNNGTLGSAKGSVKTWSNRILGISDIKTYEDLFNKMKKTAGTEGKSAYEVFTELVNNGEQVDESNNVIGTLLSNTSNLNKDEQQQLKTLIGNWNKSIVNYNTEQGKLLSAEKAANEAGKEYYEALEEYVKARSELVTKELNNINDYMDNWANHVKALAGKWASLREEMKEIGWDDRGIDGRSISLDDYYTSMSLDYEKQIYHLNHTQEVLASSISEQKKLINESIANGDLIVNSEEHRKALDTVISLENQVRSTTQEIDKLYAEMIKEVRFTPIENAINDLQKFRNNLDSVIGLITDEMKYTKDGDYTELGLASFGGDISDYRSSLQEIEDTLKLQREITNAYNERRTIDVNEVDENGEIKTVKKLLYTTEEYEKDMEEAQKKTQDALKTSQQARVQIINSITSRYKTEIDYLGELIDKRKEALQKQKEMADYDRQLKGKTNEVQRLEQEVRALQHLTDQESKAQLARKQAELTEARDELDETVQDHIVELRTEGLEDLKEELNETYEKFKKDLTINIDSIISAIFDSSQNMSGSLGAINDTIDNFLRTFNPTLSVDDLGAEELTKANTTTLPYVAHSITKANDMEHYEDTYSVHEIKRIRELQDMTSKIQNANNTLENGLNSSTKDEVNSIENGTKRIRDDIIHLEHSILLPVYNNASSSNNYLASILSQASNTSSLIESVGVDSLLNNQGNQELPVEAMSKGATNTINVQSLIHVDGNVDEDVVSKIQEIANGLISNRQFLDATYDYITKEQIKESRKSFR